MNQVSGKSTIVVCDDRKIIMELEKRLAKLESINGTTSIAEEESEYDKMAELTVTASTSGNDNYRSVQVSPTAVASWVKTPTTITNASREHVIAYKEADGIINVKIPGFGHLLSSITFKADQIKELEFWDTTTNTTVLKDSPLVHQFFNSKSSSIDGVQEVKCIFNCGGLRANPVYEFRLRGHGVKSVFGEFITLSEHEKKIWGKRMTLFPRDDNDNLYEIIKYKPVYSRGVTVNSENIDTEKRLERLEKQVEYLSRMSK